MSLNRSRRVLPSQERAEGSWREQGRRVAAPEEDEGLAAGVELGDVDAVDGLCGKDAELGELAGGLNVVDLEVGVFGCEEEDMV